MVNDNPYFTDENHGGPGAADMASAAAAPWQTTGAVVSTAVVQGVGAEAVPPLLIGGERYIGTDPDSGEKCLLLPIGDSFKYAKLVPLPDIAVHPYSAITDWLNFTFPTVLFEGDQDRAIRAVLEILGERVMPVIERRSGMYRYERSFKLGETAGMLMIGGNRGTAIGFAVR